MSLYYFFIGLAIGVAFHLWRQNLFNKKLRAILNSLGDKSNQIYDLPMASLLRREIAQLNQRCLELEAQLKTTQELLEKIPLGYLHIDEENQLLWCNHSARELLQIDRWQPGQIRLFLELVRSYELDQLIQQTRQTQQDQTKEWQFYLLNYQGDKKSRAQALKAFAHPLPQGAVAVFLQNQQPLVELTRSRERSFSDLTHELKTPLTAINAVAEILYKRLQNPEKQWVEQMLQEIARLITLIQDWLDVSQLKQDPQQYLNYQKTEIYQLILSSWQSLQPIATQKQISLSYQGPHQLYLQADTPRLTQVFINIFDNALKYSPSKGVIFLEIQPLKDNLIKINIIDCGPGFSEADLPHVFQRLYRGESSRVRETHHLKNTKQAVTNGSGLGLSIVEQIIHAHGGTIEAKNHPITKGAWLAIALPVEIKLQNG